MPSFANPCYDSQEVIADSELWGTLDIYCATDMLLLAIGVEIANPRRIVEHEGLSEDLFAHGYLRRKEIYYDNDKRDYADWCRHAGSRNIRAFLS